MGWIKTIVKIFNFMKQKFYIIVALLLFVFIVPSIALAAWYNPFTWNWSNIWNSIFHQQIVNTQQQAPQQNTEQNQNTNPQAQPSQTSVNQGSATNIAVAEMQKYTDSDFGFSFWYPASWTLKQSATTSYISPSGGTIKKTISVGTTDSNGYMGGVGIEEFASSGMSITDNSAAGPAGNGSLSLTYFFDPTTHTWMATDIDGENYSTTYAANVSTNTMGGLHMLGGNARFSDDYIIPLSAKHFLVVYALDAGGTREGLLANTILATDLSVATPVSVDEQIKIIHAEGLLYGAIGTAIPSWGFVDGNNVYDSQGNLVAGANAATFKAINTYSDGFSSPTGFATDGVNVYSEARSAKAELVPQADPATFVVIRAPYQIPYAPTSGKYGQSFTSYDMTYERDKSHVWDKGRLIPGANPNTFVVIGDAEMYANPSAQNFIFAKDANHTYGEDAKGNITIDGATIQ